jgi:hypothetical protein
MHESNHIVCIRGVYGLGKSGRSGQIHPIQPNPKKWVGSDNWVYMSLKNEKTTQKIGQNQTQPKKPTNIIFFKKIIKILSFDIQIFFIVKLGYTMV